MDWYRYLYCRIGLKWDYLWHMVDLTFLSMPQSSLSTSSVHRLRPHKICHNKLLSTTVELMKNPPLKKTTPSSSTNKI